LPFFALAWIPVLNPAKTIRARTFWSAYFAALICLVVAFHLVDLGHYDYLHRRIELSALRFTQNPLISMQMVWETYPVLWAIALLCVVSTGLFLSIRWLSSKASLRDVRPRVSIRVLTISTVVVVYALGLYGKLSYYPLRWSDAYFSTDSFSADLAMNPMLHFVNTLATAESNEIDRVQVSGTYRQMANYLGVEEPDVATLNFSRAVRPTPLAEGRPNVILIITESFAAHLTGFYGNPLAASPEFDRIAESGIAFTRFYTPSIGTAKGVFTTLTGIPDTSLGRTASRNPDAIQQQILLDALPDYTKFYFLGGSANWANIRAVLKRNINDLNLYEEGSYPNSPRSDVWGISDLHLFEEANDVLRETDAPFFAIIHLAGNHRPYTIPEDNRGFVTEVIEDDVALENGFDMVDGYNSFRFMDHSLGFLMKIAKEEEYFANTLFFLTSDNGEIGHVPGPLHPEEALGIAYHHAPFIIFGQPLKRRGELLDLVGGQMDVMPTILGALGVPAKNTSLGRNLLDPAEALGYAFIHRPWGVGRELVVLDDEFLLSKKYGVARPSLHAYRSEDPTRDLAGEQPGRTDALEAIAEGFFQTSRYMAFGRNK
jgi:phosphoglycerol transferase MdoB-like AlkP superfamily enzyme